MSDGEQVDTKELTARIREVAEELGAEYDAADVEALLADDAFGDAVELLADPAVPFTLVASLSRTRDDFVSAIALEALSRRGESDERWRRWALRNLADADIERSRWLLRAFTALPDELPVARVLAEIDEDWEGYGQLADAALFVEARLAAGEHVDAESLKALPADKESVLLSVLDHFVDEPPEEFVQAVGQWRRSLIDLDYMRAFATVHDGHGRAAELVGDRPAVVDAVVEAVRARRSVLLVGEHGVGKSSLAREALRRLGPEGWISFEAGAAAVHGGAAYVGELETRVREISDRTAGRPVAWLFPAFEESLWAGQHAQSARGLLDALLPQLESGRIVVIGELDPFALQLLVQERPRVAALLELVRVAPLEPADAYAVTRAALAGAGSADVSDATLDELLDLASHYLPGSAPPGNVVRLAKAARLRAVEAGRSAIEPADAIDALGAMTGLPLELLDPRRPLDLGGLRSFFGERVLGQPDAVDCLVERIAMVKAGLTDDTRPLGVFLFVGPTGTGKTEIAKALAEYLFGSPERMVRLDMSEYQTFDSFERLLADGATGRRAALVSSVRKEPFSVVLLDEFEKAHRNVHDLFLQVFDDARLTDAAGRRVDFRHCVLILTSNVGSAIPRDAALGFAGERAPFDSRTVERAVAQSFRPELVNRLDRVVVFRPFDREVMRSLLELELGRVLRRRGFRMHPWAVEWDAGAVEFLLEQGFTPELGARPLKRAVERHLLAPLSLAIVESRVPEGEQFLFITARDGKRLDVSFIDPDAGPEPIAAEPPQALTVTSLALDGTGAAAEVELLRRETGRVLETVARDVASRKEAALAATRRPGFWDDPERAQALAAIEYLDRLEAASRTAESLLARLLRGSGARRDERLVRLLAGRVHVLDRALDGLLHGEPADALVAVRLPAGETGAAAAAFAAELCAMYEAWADRRGMRASPSPVPGGPGAVWGLAVTGLGAYTILAGEDGLHVLELPKGDYGTDRVSVHVAVTSLGSPRRGSDAAAPRVVRRYRREPSPLVRDAVRGWRTGRIDRVLAGDFDLF